MKKPELKYKNLYLKYKSGDILGNQNYTFCRGQEECFADFIVDYVDDVFYSEKFYNYSDLSYVTLLMQICANSIPKINIKELWNVYDVRYYSKFTKLIVEYMLTKISFNAFQTKLEDNDDYRSVYDYYILYGYLNNISLDEMITRYMKYLKKYLQRKKDTVEDVFWYFFSFINTSIIYSRGLDHLSQDANHELDRRALGIEQEYSGMFEPEPLERRDLIDTPAPMVSLVCKLLPKINLDKEYTHKFEWKHKYETLPLRDMIPLILNEKYYEADYKKSIKELVRVFLKLDNKALYKEYYSKGHWTNTIALNAIAGNTDEVLRIINDDSIELYSKEQYDLLRIRGKYYADKGLGYPKCIINKTILGLSSHEDILSVLMNDKVKVVSDYYLDHIKDYLNAKEYEQLLTHFELNDVIVYQCTTNSKVESIPISKLRTRDQEKLLKKEQEKAKERELIIQEELMKQFVKKK